MPLDVPMSETNRMFATGRFHFFLPSLPASLLSQWLKNWPVRLSSQQSHLYIACSSTRGGQTSYIYNCSGSGSSDFSSDIEETRVAPTTEAAMA